jgi:PilZ domain-containing protein
MKGKARSRGEESQRRSERVLLRLPIEVKGIGANGRPFTENTHTLVVNRNGARIHLRHTPRPNDQLTITNKRTETSCPFRVVRQAPDTLGEGPEWGVECLDPNLNFWGINFPTKTLAPADQEAIDALLECSVCRFRELAQLTLDSYRTLITHSALARECGKCGSRTTWVFSFVEAEPEEAVAQDPAPAPTTAPETAATGIERRRAKRVTVKMPIRIRLEDRREEVARTENLSTTGVCFASTLAMKEGESIRLTVGYDPGKNEKEILARVVWRKRIEGTHRALYGVHLEET